MTNENRLNPQKGRAFQEQVHKALGKYYKKEFLLDCPLPIGKPPKTHKFDLVSIDKEYVVECKNIVWTKGHNRPSAKMAQCNEAVFYLSFLPSNVHKLLVIRHDVHLFRNETLAHSYVNANRHLLRGVEVLEFDPTSNELIT